ncbi:MAG: putative quinol monooxygenase [Chloroflexota bacterium]
MVVIRILMQIQPQQREAFLKFMANSTTVSTAFSGCLKYQLFQDVNTEDSYLLYEEWETRAQFDAYLASDHMVESRTALFPMMAGKPDSAYFDAQLTT